MTKSIHYSSVSLGTVNTYKLVLTCLFKFCPTNVVNRAGIGIDLMNWRCLAPLLEHFITLPGTGTFINAPLIKGLQDTIFIFALFATPTTVVYYFLSPYIHVCVPIPNASDATILI